jgi:predicted transcriptional regulator
MTVQTITLRLPEPLYRTVRQMAQVTKRPIETVLQDSLSAVLPPL